MDGATYAQANLIKKNIRDWESKRVSMLADFDNMAGRAVDITEPEFVNMLASMRATLDRYFDSQVAPLNKQFEAL
jgi:hypothetical protein